jgi:transcriptional regulator with XRE-family HTH domain
MDNQEVIGARLKALREALSPEGARAFAERLRIAETTWNNYERGRLRISLYEAMKVIVRTGVSLD